MEGRLVISVKDKFGQIMRFSELKLEAEIKGWNPKNDPTEENHFDIADEESDILNFF